MQILSYVFAILILLLLGFWCFKLIKSVILDFKSKKENDSKVDTSKKDGSNK